MVVFIEINRGRILYMCYYSVWDKMGSAIDATTYRNPNTVDYFDYCKMAEAWWKLSMALPMLEWNLDH
jgi:hypothetical protein